jgi:hypothetical protein
MEQEKAEKSGEIKGLEADILKLKRDRQQRIIEEATIRREQQTFVRQARSCKPELEAYVMCLDDTILSLDVLSTICRYSSNFKEGLEAQRKYA